MLEILENIEFSQQQQPTDCGAQDVCPGGQLVLGLASLAPLLVPGILYSISTFLHYQGDIMQCGVGKPFNIPSSKLGEAIAIIPSLTERVLHEKQPAGVLLSSC